MAAKLRTSDHCHAIPADSPSYVRLTLAIIGTRHTGNGPTFSSTPPQYFPEKATSISQRKTRKTLIPSRYNTIRCHLSDTLHTGAPSLTSRVKISNDSPSTSNDSTPPSFNCARLFDLTTGEALHPQKSVTPLLFDESTTLRCIQSQLTAPGLTRWSGSGSTASRCSARHGRSLGLPGSRGFGDFTSADFRTTGHGQRA